MILVVWQRFWRVCHGLSLTGGFINLVTIVIGSQIKGDVLTIPASGMRWRWAWSSS